MKIGAIAAAALMLPGVALSQETYTLRLADQFPLTHIASVLTIAPFIEKVEEKTDGAVTFQHFPAQQLADASGMLEAVRTGVADLALQVAGQASDRLPLSTVVELPSISADIEQCYSAFQTLADGELLEREYQPLGVRAIEVNCTPPQFLTTRQEELTSMEDLEGLKIRAGGSAVELTLDQLGIIPVNMTAPDIYVSIERGTLDGAVFAAASSLGYNLQNIVKGVAQNVSFGSNAAILFMNEEKFQSLPEEYQQAILEAGREVGQDVAVAYNKNSEEALAEMAEAGVNVYDLPEDVVAEIRAAQEAVSEEWVSQMSGRNLAGEEVLSAAREAAGLTN